MSEQEEMRMFERIREGIKDAQVRMLERKVKLGETVVIADANGKPMIVSAQDALSSYGVSSAE